MKEYRLGVNEYLEPSMIAQLLGEKENYVVISDTNTGKTQACIKAAQESGQRFVFAVDTKILADQLGVLYGLPVYYAEKKTLPSGNCITLFNHIHLFRGNATVLFIDEFHSIVKDYGYKKDLIDNVIREFPNFKQVIGLTGTPLAKMAGFREIKVIRDRPERVIKLINYRHDYMDDLIWNIMTNRNKIHYVSIFNKSNHAISISATLQANGLPKEEIAQLNSETKKSKAFQEIVSNRKTAGCKVIITTYTQGFNIEGTGHMLHIIPIGSALHSPADIEQVVNRFRDEVPEVKLYWNHEPNYETQFNETKQFEEEEREARELIRRFLGSFKLNSTNTLDPLQMNMLNNHLNAESILNVTMDCKENQVGIRYNIYSKKTAEIYRDINYMMETLQAYSYKIEVQEDNEYLIDTSSSEAEGLKVSLQQLKEEQYRERLLEIHNDTDEFSYSPDELTIKYNKLAKYYGRDVAFTKMNEMLMDKKKWNKELGIISAKFSNTFINTSLKATVYSTFTEERYTSKDILNKMNGIHRSLGIPEIPTSTKATQILDTYFETIPWKVTKGTGGRRSGRKIIKRLID